MGDGRWGLGLGLGGSEYTVHNRNGREGERERNRRGGGGVRWIENDLSRKLSIYLSNVNALTFCAEFGS